MKIEFIRGDTYSFKFQRKLKNDEVISERPDQVFFSVKESYDDEECLFQKRLSNNTIIYDETDNYYYITIDSEDTCNLDCESYVFDIEVIKDNVVKTLVVGRLRLLIEVTHKRNEVFD
ncbi:MAG: hypothetical protein HFI09_04100 [Bacilli bacterium]|nr:hypothetical protein [Bacilli bacterium]